MKFVRPLLAKCFIWLSSRSWRLLVTCSNTDIYRQNYTVTAKKRHLDFHRLKRSFVFYRITAAMEKVELLWQQAFSKARLQLQMFQLREDALQASLCFHVLNKPRLPLKFRTASTNQDVFPLCVQITEQIKTLLQEKLQPYKIEIAKDAARAVMLVSEFEVSIHTPAMVTILLFGFIAIPLYDLRVSYRYIEVL